ncbi:MAG: hypothetical protein V1776_05605 [Candidatus Diapherotrites archaeon]
MNWQEELRTNIRSIDLLRNYYVSLSVNKQEAIEIEKVVQKSGVNIPRRYLEDLIASIKSEKELEQVKNMVLPRLNLDQNIETRHTLVDDDHLDNNPVKGLTQMYPDRVLVSPNYSCMNHCLWCFRDKENISLNQEELRQIYGYIAKHPNIKDVILTGGEPLLTSDARLEGILRSLREIGHVDIVRFHTRAPVVLPSRIDESFLKIVNKYKSKGKPFYVVTQFVHPSELSESSTDAIYRLTKNGIMVLNQSPILKGINDTQETFNELNQKLIKNQIKPYYAIATIVKEGVNERFYVPFEKVEKLVNEYSSVYDGLGRPILVVPVMGKKLTPNQLRESMERYGSHFRNTKRDI